MTFVKGQSTWAAIASDLTKLACGEMADGSGVTVATGDRWVREYDTTVDAIRSHASKDVNTGACSMRMGYWALTTPGVNGVGLSTFLRQMTCFGSKPAWVGANGRWAYRVVATTTNGTTGDYSTARVAIYSWDMDSGNYNSSGNQLIPASDGTVTFDGMTFKVGDPSGFLPTGVAWIRMFTSTYLGGIDFWPMYSRRSAAATFTVNPSGANPTDWDIAEVAPPFPYCNNQPVYSSSASTSASTQWWAGWGSGLGIKTNAALTGALYTLSFPMALHKLRIAQSATAGSLRLDYGRLVLDGATYRRVSGQGTSSWVPAFQTPAQVTNAAVISYWMLVKPDCIIVTLSGDPGLSGKVGCGHVSTFTPYDTTYDVLPVLWNQGATDFTNDHSNYTAADVLRYQYAYWAMRRRQDGTEGTRDWQTKWMRTDLFDYGVAWSGQDARDDAGIVEYVWGSHWDPVGSTRGGEHASIFPVRQLKPHPFDNRWWFYGLPVGDSDPFSNYATPLSAGTQDHHFVRGVINNRWWWLPGDGWANLDELTDNSTGQKYLLVAADYQGVGARMRVGTNLYIGGVAIAEV